MNQELKKLILQNAALYDAQMNEMKLALYAQLLKDVPIRECARAFHHFANEKGRRFLPMPADILDFLDPKRDPKIEAREAASRVIEAISKFGYPSPEKAKAYIGELGWRLVERFGGWQTLCEQTGVDMNVNTLLAQMRDVGEAMSTRYEKGYGDEAPSLTENKKHIQSLIELAKPKQIE